MTYIPTHLNDSIRLEKLYTIHYFEYMSDFTFEGESHNFWEFIYVDRGEVNVIAGKREICLKKGEILFHQPNEFHAVKATGFSAPNLIVISFASSSPAMRFFTERLLSLDDKEQSILADIIVEARRCFSSRLDDPYLFHMEKKTSDMFASEQMIRIHLEHLLIHIIRRQSRLHALNSYSIPRNKVVRRNQSIEDTFYNVIEYLESRINEKITLEQICHDNSIGRSQLQKIFHQKKNCSVMEYFSNLKIATAKQMLRTNQYNITQISEKLGYSSVHYFYRQFKKTTGMSPTEYSSSIKAISDGSFK